MSENTPETIFPCPFSKGYGIPAGQAWLLLKIFLTYRFILASLFIVLFQAQLGPSSLGSLDGRLYLYTSQSYLMLSVISAICIAWRLTGYTLQAQLLIFTDIVILTLLMHACGGINSGIGILLAVSISYGGLLIGGRCAMFFAAVASLAVLSEQIYADQADLFEKTSYMYAGMLGASFFTIALLSYVLATRSEQTVLLAHQQKQTITQLEELNHYIIQHLQSGIIITNKKQAIQMVNEAALRLANLPAMPATLADISEQLWLDFQIWLNEPEQAVAQLQFANRSEIHIRFMPLPTQQECLYLITLEDIALHNQRLQQSKLASLGRLTASIAHEIRNPLSAISHAGQLLSENPQLSAQDKRLTEIIQAHSCRVNRIIEDILQLSRRNASRREKIQLNAWLTDYLNNFMLDQAVDAGTFRLSISTEPLYALIDPGHLKQILDNLCQNALRYGKPELGMITLRARASEQMPCIEVIDNGSGLTPEQISHLFEPFFTTSHSGTGLGLYISRELAELNQAKLSYYLTDKNRSCFKLCLPDAENKLIEI
jgi:two-component system sensor histidine kinase PilS (NtrC family)